MLNVWLGIWLLLNVFAASPSVSARKLHHESRQSDLEPDYASRRRIRDVEADREGEGGGEAEAEAGAAADANMRFIETHRQLDSPQSEDEVEANAVKAKLMMQAESLGISNPDNYAQSVVQQAVDQEIEQEPSGELSEAAIHRAEVELAGMFSGVISAVMSNVMHDSPQLFGGQEASQDEL